MCAWAATRDATVVGWRKVKKKRYPYDEVGVTCPFCRDVTPRPAPVGWRLSLAPSEHSRAQPSKRLRSWRQPAFKWSCGLMGKPAVSATSPCVSPSVGLLPRLDSAAVPAPPKVQSQSCSCQAPPRQRGCKSQVKGPCLWQPVQQGQTSVS